MNVQFNLASISTLHIFNVYIYMTVPMCTYMLLIFYKLLAYDRQEEKSHLQKSPHECLVGSISVQLCFLDIFSRDKRNFFKLFFFKILV